MRRRSFRRFSKQKFIVLLLAVIVSFLWSFFEIEGKTPIIVSENLAVAQDLSKQTSVRVCTWNVRNYNVSNRRVNGRWVSYPKSEAERDEIATTLAKINADIVLLQEMGDATYMRDLCERLKKAGTNYAFASVASFDSSLRLAILCKAKPTKVFDFSDTYFRFNKQKMYSPRGTFGIKIDVKSHSIYAFTIHLKSKLSAKKEDENFVPFRRAELKSIVRRIEKTTGKESLVIVGGDFNDEPTKYLMKSAGEFKVVNQADLLGAKSTYHWHKKNEFFMYDYFLASKNLLPFLHKGVVCPKTNASDHRPVFVDITLEK